MSKPTEKKKIMLALQGGAAYGAFTWGVIDRLLEDDRIDITAVSGTSAGALNASALAHGLDENGKDGAKAKVKAVWESLTYDEVVKQVPYVGETGSKSNRALSKLFKKFSSGNAHADFIKSLQAVTQGATLSLINSTEGLFEETLEKTVDFDKLKNKKDGIPVFVAATDINDHKARIFDRSDLSATAVKASCALPVIIGEVEIDGKMYWDGGYTSNPPLRPLMECEDQDILIVQTMPMVERDDDAAVDSVTGQIMEFSNNASLRHELEAIDKDNERVRKDPDAAEKLGMKEIHTHTIHMGKSMKAEHMMCFDRDHLEELYDSGYKAAEKWLADNFDDLGKKSTFVRTASTAPAHEPQKQRKNTRFRPH